MHVSDAKDGWISFAISTPELPDAAAGNPARGRHRRATAGRATGDEGTELRRHEHRRARSVFERWSQAARRWVDDTAPTSRPHPKRRERRHRRRAPERAREHAAVRVRRRGARRRHSGRRSVLARRPRAGRRRRSTTTRSRTRPRCALLTGRCRDPRAAARGEAVHGHTRRPPVGHEPPHHLRERLVPRPRRREAAAGEGQRGRGSGALHRRRARARRRARGCAGRSPCACGGQSAAANFTYVVG